MRASEAWGHREKRPWRDEEEWAWYRDNRQSAWEEAAQPGATDWSSDDIPAAQAQPHVDADARAWTGGSGGGGHASDYDYGYGRHSGHTRSRSRGDANSWENHERTRTTYESTVLEVTERSERHVAPVSKARPPTRTKGSNSLKGKGKSRGRSTEPGLPGDVPHVVVSRGETGDGELNGYSTNNHQAFVTRLLRSLRGLLESVAKKQVEEVKAGEATRIQVNQIQFAQAQFIDDIFALCGRQHDTTQTRLRNLLSQSNEHTITLEALTQAQLQFQADLQAQKSTADELVKTMHGTQASNEHVQQHIRVLCSMLAAAGVQQHHCPDLPQAPAAGAVGAGSSSGGGDGTGGGGGK